MLKGRLNALKMEHENLNKQESPDGDSDAVRRTPFKISVDDGFCKWEYGFKPENVYDICINDIVNAIEEHFKTKMVYAKLLR